MRVMGTGHGGTRREIQVDGEKWGLAYGDSSVVITTSLSMPNIYRPRNTFILAWVRRLLS